MDYAVAVPDLGRRHRRHPLRALPGTRRAAQYFRQDGRLRRHPPADARDTHRLAAFPLGQGRDYSALRQEAASHELGFDAVNSNTFQDQKDQKLSYKFGSLTHADKAARDQAVEHNLECIEIGRKLGSTALTVWIADGSNFRRPVESQCRLRPLYGLARRGL